MGLTAEQLERIEKNKREALFRRQQREQNSNIVAQPQPQTTPKVHIPSIFNPPKKQNSTSFRSYEPVLTNAIQNQASTSKPSQSSQKFVVILSVISIERFEIRCKYDAEIVKHVQNMPTKSYDAKTKHWSFLYSDYHNLVKVLESNREIMERIVLEKIPPWVLKNIRTKCEPLPEDSYLENRIDPQLWNKLFPYQREGIGFVVSKKGRALLADDMGLGKTIQALGVASFYRSHWPLLIVCPSSVKGAWLESIQTWLKSVNIDDVTVVDKSDQYVDPPPKADSIIITSYDLMSGLQTKIINRKFDVVIFDESHLLKSETAQRTKAANKIAKIAHVLLLLSGTPALSRPKELFSQLKMLRPSQFPNFHEFGARYCAGKYEPCKFNPCGKRFVAEGASNMDELHKILRHVIMIRRLKSEVIKWLPDKKRQMVILDQAEVKTDMKNLETARKEMERLDLTKSARRGALLVLYRESSEVKKKPVLNYILESLKETNKVIVFLHHKSMMDYLMTGLDQNSINFEWIEGATSAQNRDLAVANFQSKEEMQVVLLSITAASTGITLTAANTVVFAELFWNPGILVQAEDRAHRLGQESTVYVKYLVATGTSDDFMWPMVKEKLQILNQVGLSKDNFNTADTTVIRDDPELQKKQRQKQRLLEDFFTVISEDDASIIEMSDRQLNEDHAQTNEPKNKQRKQCHDSIDSSLNHII